jgi:hypothetical protein
MPFGTFSRGGGTRGRCVVTPWRPRIWGGQQHQATKLRAPIFTAIRPAKKAGCRTGYSPPIGGIRRTGGLATGSVGHYVAEGKAIVEGEAAGMNQSLLQLISFVVLAAIILATGFGAF